MMNSVLTGMVGVVLGLAAGFFIFSDHGGANGTEITESMNDMHDTHMSDDENMEHEHAMLEVEPGVPVPTVAVEALKDTKDGYNLHIKTTNFTLNAERVNTEPTQGEGHTHIYVNGDKLARVYDNWFHVSSEHLQAGENEIVVTLNANDHSEWMINGEHISDTVTVTK